MKAALIIIAMIGTLMFAASYVTRWFSAQTVTIVVVEAEPGVFCAQATTEHSVSIDCWRE